MRSCDAAVGRRLAPRMTTWAMTWGTMRAMIWGTTRAMVSVPTRATLLLLVATLQVLIGTGLAHAQREDYELPPIDYLNAEVDDPVARLAKRIERGETKLPFDSRHGYLPAVLKELDVPVSSQTLVFSKTSLQLSRISPRTPRALYFNDDVYVGFCREGDVLELAATDAKQGPTFYTLEQSSSETPKFVRDRGGCLSCHATSRTRNVPGYLVRSVFADPSGRPRLGSGTFTTDQRSPFQDRWGGWYVTGTHGSMRHMGNTISTDDERTFDREAGANAADLSHYFRTEFYLTPHSDIVALMVMEHQTQMHNAITAANFETRQALHQSFQMNKVMNRPEGFISDSAQRRIASAADDLLRYLLMTDEFPLTDTVAGPTRFAEEFQSRGKRDAKGRTLRELDLQTRLFKYPCSYLIESPAFAALPAEVKTVVFDRLRGILEGEENAPDFAHLSPTLRREILEILEGTIPEFKTTNLATN